MREETIGCAVLDTGCNVNVCGSKWLEEYEDMLDEIDKKLVKEGKTQRYFRFGDGKSVKAYKRVWIPGYIDKEKIEIETEVIESDIPLLLSKTFMKQMGMIISLVDDRILWRKGEIKDLKITTTGHYAIAINKCQNFEGDRNFMKYILYSYGLRDSKVKALKLHRQFAHPSKEKLIKLIREAGIRDSELEEEVRRIEENCETCTKFKRNPCRPVVSMPMARNFNDIVSMDLKVWHDKYFLVMVDMATRYCNACVINCKTARVVIDSIMRHWVALFGSPKKILTDNGGEFNNNEFRSMGDNFNIEVICTAAESPWSNGICERLNAVLKDNVLKILEEQDCSLETALAWAVAARNSLHNNHGFSPNQLVFSFNPGLPNIADDRPPALENVTSSQIVANNLNALRKSREEFIKSDANERIRRALSRNITKTEDDKVELGNFVYYKRDGEDSWRGPARVIGKDGKINILRHGGQVVRAHICRVRGIEKREPLSNAQEKSVRDSDERNGKVSLHEQNNESEVDDNVEEGRVIEAKTNEVCKVADDTEVSDKSASEAGMPKVGKRYEVTLADSNEKMNVKILSRAGKATGKYKDCYNYHNEGNGQESWIDFSKDVSKIREMQENEEVMITISDEKTMEAKQKEIESWIDNEVFEEVEWEGQPMISVRWIVTEKIKKEGKIIKARLVARGFEEELEENITAESPTCSKEALRIALVVILMMQWSCNTIDIKSAYLQGHGINREVYLQPPPEFFRGKVWKLKKTVYGLRDAARAWYDTVREELVRLGMKTSRYDPAMFLWKKGDTLEGIVCIHVDDFCWGGSKQFEEIVISKLKKDFLVGTTDTGNFKYVGLDIKQEKEGIKLDQENYIKSLHQIEISQRKSQRKNMNLNEEEMHQFRSLVGQLNWIGTQTRPDISFDVCYLSMKFGKSTIDDLMEANKVIKRVKTDQVSLFLPLLSGNIHLECYCDASFANHSDCHSQAGFIIFIADGNGRRCPIMWKSRKIRRVVNSTLAAETMALVEVAESAHYIQSILEDIGVNGVSLKCFVDSKSLVDALRSMKQVDNKYLRINMAILKEMLQKGEITSVEWIDTKKQVANCLTKKGASPAALLEAISQ